MKRLDRLLERYFIFAILKMGIPQKDVTFTITIYYENFADFKLAISNWIETANTERKEKLDSLLTLNFQSFSKVHVLTV